MITSTLCKKSLRKYAYNGCPRWREYYGFVSFKIRQANISIECSYFYNKNNTEKASTGKEINKLVDETIFSEKGR